MEDNYLVPIDIQDSILDFFIQSADKGDDYWASEKWELVRYSHQVKLVFIRSLIKDWSRLDYPEREGELDSYLQKATGRKKLRVGYFKPRQTVEIVEEDYNEQ